jgi:folylpolyglutamate synthase/dihydropteroate synthase
MQPIAERFARGSVTKSESVSNALQAALRQTPRHGLICVTGSLYLIGEWKQIT